jgi:phosphoserine phosphatase
VTDQVTGGSVGPAAGEPPLCVDLDGTLLDGDCLLISLRLLTLRAPWLLPALPFALLRGRPALKAYVARRIIPDPGGLPWRLEVVGWVRRQRESGRRVYLVTATDERVAAVMARHLDCFDGVLATHKGQNLKAHRKVAAIRNLLRDNEFDYVGDSRADLPVFAAARYCYLVAPSARLEAQARRVARVRGVFTGRGDPAARSG